jgi:hypothetical protein
MDPNFDDIRPEYVETVRRWQPIDLRVMSFAIDHRSTDTPYFSAGDVHNLDSELRETAIQISIDHLVELKCLRQNPQHGYIMSAYGTEIMLAVSART